MSKKELIRRLKKSFDDHANKIDGVELWFGRDLQELLGYTQWRKFVGVIDRAKIAREKLTNQEKI